MRLKALLLPVLVLSAGCSQLVETFDPPTVLQARVTAQSTPVTVQDVGEYPVGQATLTAQNLKTDSLEVELSLVSPPAGVALASSSQTATVTSQGARVDLKLVLNPSQLFTGTETSKTLNLTLRVAPIAPGGPQPVTASFSLTVQRQGGGGGGGGTGGGTTQNSSIGLAMNLNRQVVYAGQTLQGSAVVTSQSGASGLVVVEVVPQGCTLPQGSVRYTTANYGDLQANGTFAVSFAVDVPANAQAGTCTLVATARMSGNLQATASARFDILANPAIELSFGAPSPVFRGDRAASVPFTLTPKGGWTGTVEFRLWNTTGGNPVTLTPSTTPTYVILVGDQYYAPDDQGDAYIPVNGEVRGYVVVVQPTGWQAGEYTFLARAIGPNIVQADFKITVIGPQQ